MNIHKKRIKGLNNFDGFTLLEVLISISILSFLMIGVYQIVDSSSNTKERITSEDRNRMQLEIGLSRLSRDIEFIYSPLYYESTKQADEQERRKSKITPLPDGINPNAQVPATYEESVQKVSQYTRNDNFAGLSESGRPIPVIFNESKNSLTFLSTSGRRLIKDSKQSNFQWIRYRLRATPDLEDETEIEFGKFSLARTVINQDIFSPNIDWDTAKEYDVIANLNSLTFNFWDPERKKFVESLKELNQTKYTPRLIRVKMNYHSPTGERYEGIRDFGVMWPNIDVKKNLKEKYDTSKFKKNAPTGSLKGK